jgi:hypothetical protein
VEPSGERPRVIGAQARHPTKMAKARLRLMLRDAMRMAMEKEKIMPTLAKVRSIPEEMPNAVGGETFITAELLAGKKQLAPRPLTTLQPPPPIARWWRR